MRAGRRDTLVTFERGTATLDGFGGETLAWASLGREWAQVFYGRGNERREAAQEMGDQAATFAVLANPMTLGVRLKDRLILNGQAWDIVGISPVDRSTIEFTAVRS